MNAVPVLNLRVCVCVGKTVVNFLVFLPRSPPLPLSLFLLVVLPFEYLPDLSPAHAESQ